jgi:hypothetical protein
MTVPNENSVQPTSPATPRDERQSRSSWRPSLILTNEVLVLRQIPARPEFDACNKLHDTRICD